MNNLGFTLRRKRKNNKKKEFDRLAKRKQGK